MDNHLDKNNSSVGTYIALAQLSTEHTPNLALSCVPIYACSEPRLKSVIAIHCESKKTRQYNIVHNFAKCWPIFNFFSLTD